MIPRVDVGTRLVALLGDPVDHSLSPVFQNAAFRAAGVPGLYLPLRCSADELPGLMREIVGGGGAGNVTVPHKERAARVVDRPGEAVVRTGACNTFWGEGGALQGDNTDVAGFRAAARALLGSDLSGGRVLLLGAGGAARAVLAALQDEAAGEAVIVNRTPARAEALAREFGGGRLHLRPASPSEVPRAGRFDLVVNATSLGLRPHDPLPLHPEKVDAAAALDLVYAPAGTPWSRAFAAHGVPSADGIEMLIGQGAAAFERWWGRPPPIEAMRTALEEATTPH